MKVFLSYSSMDVEAMTAAEIRGALERSFNVEPLERDFRKKACLETDQARTLIARGGTGKSILMHSLQGWRPFTFEIRGRTREERRTSFHDFFEPLGNAIVYAAHSEPRFDTVWPYMDTLQRLALHVSDDRDLAEEYVQSFIKLLCDASPGLAGYALGWTIQSLYDQSPACARIAQRIASLMTERGSPVEGQVALALMEHARAGVVEHLPRITPGLPPAAVAAWSSFVDHSMGVAREICTCLLHHREDSIATTDPVVRKLVGLMAELRDDVPLYGMLAMASARRALQLVGSMMRSRSRRIGHKLVQQLCDLLFDHVGKNGTSSFLALEALEGLREEVPRECEIALAKLLPKEASEFAIDPVFLDETFWDEAAKRLMAYAEFRLRHTAWRGSFGLPAGAKTAEDYVQQAVMLILNGTRCYEPRYGSHLAFVTRVIGSLISHDAAKRENCARHVLIELMEEAIAGTSPPPDQTLAAQDLLQQFKLRLPHRCWNYVDFVATDECLTTKEVANAMKLSEQEVRNMARIVRQRRECWEGSPPPRTSAG
jgi:hypothetical protein